MLVRVAMYRQLFGLRVKDRLVASWHRVVSLVLWLIRLLVTGTTALIFYVVFVVWEAPLTAVPFAVALKVSLFIIPSID